MAAAGETNTPVSIASEAEWQPCSDASEEERHQWDRRIRRRRQRWIDAFRERQRRDPAWINFADIAEWCAHEGQSDIRPADDKRDAAYGELWKALKRGEFDDRDGIMTVLFLCPRARLRRMTREYFNSVIPTPFQTGGCLLPTHPPVQFTAAYLQWCWIPNQAARRWFERRARLAPDALLSLPPDETTAKQFECSQAPIVVQPVEAAQEQRRGERPSSGENQTLEPISKGTKCQILSTRGRKPRYNWAKADRELGACLHANGCPEPNDGGQAALEKMVADSFPSDQCPSESVIRERVAKAIEAHRRTLAEPASEI